MIFPDRLSGGRERCWNRVNRRRRAIELRCRSEEYPDATFLTYWPHGTDRFHMVGPKKFARGSA